QARLFHHAFLTAPRSIVLTGAGCMVLAASSDLANTFDAPRQGGPFVAVLLCTTLALAFVLFIKATLPPQPLPKAQSKSNTLLGILRRLQPYLTYIILGWALITALQSPAILGRGLMRGFTQWPPSYGSDDLYYNHYNATLVLHGDNPYTGTRLLDEVRYFDKLDFTPLARGRFANPHHYPSRAEMDAVIREYQAHPQTVPVEIDPRTTHSYPAGAFLVNLPAVWLGIPSVAITQIAALLVLLCLILWATPAPWRLVATLLLLSTVDGIRQVTGGDFEIWPLVFVAGAWLAREHRWRSALLLGAACAIKQTAWIAAPFYLLWVWRTYGRSEALHRLGVVLGAFLALNLPWIIASPRPWLESQLLPVTLPLLPDGSGIIGLSLTGLLPLAPSMFYSILELAALLAALAWYWRAAPRAPSAGLVLPLVPLFFAWRSSERYFVLLPLLAVLALALTLRQTQTLPQKGRRELKGEQA
ncbi:MAG: hypothetical protein ACXVA4_14275, partial [Ktedonobacterales bacterium]